MNIWSPGFIQRQRTWVAVAIGGGAVVGAGAGLIGDSMNGGKPQIQDQYTQGPSYAAGQTAQTDWLNQLTSDQNDPTGNFGAISPDWNDIWQQTQQQVQNYYSGTATNPGVNDQINASFAQRGMSGDPAASFLQAQSGANEAQQLGNLSAQQNIAKNEFAQQGKQNWYSNINNFQNATAGEQGNWSGGFASPTEGQQIANTVGTAASGVAAAGLQAQGQNNQLAYLQNYLNPNPSSFAPTSLQGAAGPEGNALGF